MSPVETEYYDLVRYAITSDGNFLTWPYMNPQLGVPTDINSLRALGRAWHDTTMKVTTFDSFKCPNLGLLTRTVVLFATIQQCQEEMDPPDAVEMTRQL